MPFAPPGSKFFLVGASTPDGPLDIVSGKATGGNLTTDGFYLPLYDDEGTINTSFPLSTGEQGSYKTLGNLGLTPSTFTGTSVLPKNKGTFIDEDGDTYTVKLSGPGAVAVNLDDTNASGGNFIEQIFLQDTDPKKSKLSVTVKKASGGDGLVKVGRIVGVALASITGAAIDLMQSGITLSGPLGSATLHDVLNGAGITTAAGTNVKAKTRLTIRNVGDAAAIAIGTPISKFSAKLVGDASIATPSIDALIVAGDFAADIVTGTLGSATVGKLLDAQWTLDGDVKSITVKQMINSTIYDGVVDGATGLPLAVDAFSAQRTIKKFTVRGEKNDPIGFSDSFVAAYSLDAVSVASIVKDNGGETFGFAAHLLKSITLREVTTTVLKWTDKLDPSELVAQDDLVVRIV